MKVITITNLKDYQHYGKGRESNPWIKWHKKCLRDHKFRQLTNAERWIFIGLILLAVENNNKIPADFHDIALIISHSSSRFSEAIVKLVDLKLIAIKRIAERKQNGATDKTVVEDIKKQDRIIFLLKDWNERQPSPITSFNPKNIVLKYGVEKIETLLKKYGKENKGFGQFLNCLKDNV